MRQMHEYRQRSIHFSVLLALALSAAALPLTGCESTPVVHPRTDRSSAIEQTPDPAPKESEAASELASLAERDVQAFLDRQPRQETPRGESPARPVRTDREILWNLPDDPRTGEFQIDVPEARSSELFLVPDNRESDETITETNDESRDDNVAIDRDRIRELIVELSKDLYREATYADMPLRELMLIAATTIVTPDRALEPDAIPALTDRERELLREFQAFFIRLGHDLDGSRTADDVLLHALDELRASVSTKPQLLLETMALCTRVGGFGDYDPFNRYSFLAHAEQQAVLYLEIAGFTSELNQQGQWVTELSLQVMIYSDRDGIPVWRDDWQTAVDVSRNKRQDFFMVQILTVPKALSVGRYHLKVRVRDEKSGAEAEGSIPFEMVADPKLAVGAGR